MLIKIKTWLKSKKNGILALAFSAMLIITLAIPTSADDSITYNNEVGRNIVMLYGITSGDADVNPYSLIRGISVNGNNYPSLHAPNPQYSTLSGYIGGDLINDFNTWELETSSYGSNPYDYLALYINGLYYEPNTMSVSLTDFYINVEFVQQTGTYVYDNIWFTINQEFYGALTDVSFATMTYELKYCDLLDVNSNGDIQYTEKRGELYFSDEDVTTGEATAEFDILEFFDQPDEPFLEKLFYIEYLTIHLDLGELNELSTHYINIEYDFKSSVEFEYDSETYFLVTQSDFDAFRIQQFSIDEFGGTIPVEYFRPYADWIAEAVSGFFSFQLFPGFYLGGIIVAVVAFCLVMWWLKMFGGG